MAALAFDRGGTARPSELIGPEYTTSAGVTGSLRRLVEAGLVTQVAGDDKRTRPVSLTSEGQVLISEIVDPWQTWFESALDNLDDNERSDLYRLLVKGSGLWTDVWPDEFTAEQPTPDSLLAEGQ
ncbi:MAG: hypothetical protein GY929_23555 [Actinomycetia bacterium]|nr:hypothetical protein [Actinomycetes bacterium]